MTNSVEALAAPPASFSRQAGQFIRRTGVLIAFLAVCAFLSISSPIFLTPPNLLNILSQSVVLTLVAMAMTLVITAGGIDLSVGVAFDFAAMLAISLLKLHYPWYVAILSGLVLGTTVGAFNALMIVKIGISPFLATLGMMFIGESVQRIYTHGGEPIYMAAMAPAYRFLGAGKLWSGGLSFSVVLAALVVLVFFLLIERTVHGRRWRALGAQYEAARIAGIRVELYSAASYVLGSLVCAGAGILLSASLSSYVPISGGAYLLDSIGATFIGASLDPEGRPNVLGTVLGVVFLGVVANGLNLIGLNFYWQAVARGLLIFVALLFGVLNQRKAA